VGAVKTRRACVMPAEAVGEASARGGVGRAGRWRRERPGPALAVGGVDPLTVSRLLLLLTVHCTTNSP
jgi:hypothetical protein